MLFCASNASGPNVLAARETNINMHTMLVCGSTRGVRSFFSDVALVMIDEVHVLNDSRGGSLEAVISRIKMISKLSEVKTLPLSSVRYVAVSATIPNIKDIGHWLECPSVNLLQGDDNLRPVRLQTHVIGYERTCNDFLFDRRLNEKVFEILHRYSKVWWRK